MAIKMENVKAKHPTFIIKEEVENGISQTRITIKSKISIWVLICSIIFIVLLWFYFPLSLHDTGGIGDIISTFLILILFLFYSLVNAIGVLWMLFGKEEIVLKGNGIFIYKKVFNCSFIYRNYSYEETSKWFVSTILPDDLCQSKWFLIQLLHMSYNSYSFHAAYGLKGGKIIFTVKEKFKRFGINIDETQANEILEVVNKYYNNQNEHVEIKERLIYEKSFNSGFDLINILFWILFSVFILLLGVVLLNNHFK